MRFTLLCVVFLIAAFAVGTSAVLPYTFSFVSSTGWFEGQKQEEQPEKGEEKESQAQAGGRQEQQGEQQPGQGQSAGQQEQPKTEAQLRAEQLLGALENQEQQVLKFQSGINNPQPRIRRVSEKDW